MSCISRNLTGPVTVTRNLKKYGNFFPRQELDVEQIRKDMNDPAIVKLIEQDLADAKTLNVQKTPGFFVNGKPLQTFGYQQLQGIGSI